MYGKKLCALLTLLMSCSLLQALQVGIDPDQLGPVEPGEGCYEAIREKLLGDLLPEDELVSEELPSTDSMGADEMDQDISKEEDQEGMPSVPTEDDEDLGAAGDDQAEAPTGMLGLDDAGDMSGEAEVFTDADVAEGEAALEDPDIQVIINNYEDDDDDKALIAALLAAGLGAGAIAYMMKKKWDNRKKGKISGPTNVRKMPVPQNIQDELDRMKAEEEAKKKPLMLTDETDKDAKKPLAITDETKKPMGALTYNPDEADKDKQQTLDDIDKKLTALPDKTDKPLALEYKPDATDDVDKALAGDQNKDESEEDRKKRLAKQLAEEAVAEKDRRDALKSPGGLDAGDGKPGLPDRQAGVGTTGQPLAATLDKALQAQKATMEQAPQPQKATLTSPAASASSMGSAGARYSRMAVGSSQDDSGVPSSKALSGSVGKVGTTAGLDLASTSAPKGPMLNIAAERAKLGLGGVSAGSAQKTIVPPTRTSIPKPPTTAPSWPTLKPTPVTAKKPATTMGAELDKNPLFNKMKAQAEGSAKVGTGTGSTAYTRKK